MRTRIAVAMAALVLVAGFVAAADVPKVAEPAKGKAIELVICLDTSNSMDGLIASAKAKLWDIVNELAKAKPTPTLKVALYSYGNTTYDANKGWVRQDIDFTTDLDKVNDKLFKLTTSGGTEYVGRVCNAALEELKWSADAGTLKVIFVCGNEPADQDKQHPLKDVAEKACRKGVIINTIYCGPANSGEVAGWKGFSDLAEGRFASIDQNRGAVAVATPHDKKIAELSQKMNSTFLFYGAEGKALRENQLRQDANAAKTSPQAEASRGVSKSGDLYKYEADLVQKCKEDPKFDVKKVAEAELPEELKKMKPEEREAYVKTKVAEREKLQKDIGELAKLRDDFIKAELKKNPNPGEKLFDEAVRAMLRDQSQKKGLTIPE
jgi:hypothetical protein